VDPLENRQNEYSKKLQQLAKNPDPTQEIKINDVGIVKVYGKWDSEKIIKRLLESEQITG
jgi:hypothetical protein